MLSLKRLGKRGDEKYYIIISIILGLVVLFLVLYFIFQEYFTSNELSYETCRQSVVLRSGNIANGVKKIQETFPFKCKTQVININFQNKTKAGLLIADTMAQCWTLFGEGKTPLYKSDFVGSENRCFNCARIHFDPSVVNYYSGNRNYASEEQKVETDIKNKPDVKAKAAQIAQIDSQLAQSTSLSQQQYAIEDQLKTLNTELSGKQTTATQAQLNDIQNKINDLNQQLTDIKAKREIVYNLIDQRTVLEDQYNALVAQYSNAAHIFYSSGFNWNNYLSKTMGTTGMTYGQYIYGWSDKNSILSNNAFSTESFSKNVVYSDKFDPAQGDLIISLVYKTGAFNFYFWESGYGLVLIPHQTSQQISCDGTETIPA